VNPRLTPAKGRRTIVTRIRQAAALIGMLVAAATGAFYGSLDDAGKATLRDTVRASLPEAPFTLRRAPGSRWEPFRAKGRFAGNGCWLSQ
jgi:hypothetical protein